ncbi:hypothetical protein Bbelb_109470 [Branchiostoma belcheri]|nr:hypothetical protein Bbelb_109470 [Branchiostoma belcheri]
MRLPPDSRQTTPLRTLATITADFERFQAEGKGNIKKANNYINVIARPLNDIPIDQVCIPGLHISVGLYQKMFKMLESDLPELDMILATTLTNGFLEDTDTDRAQVLHDYRLHGLEPYVDAVDAARAEEQKAADLQDEIDEREKWLVPSAVGIEHALHFGLPGVTFYVSSTPAERRRDGTTPYWPGTARLWRAVVVPMQLNSHSLRQKAVRGVLPYANIGELITRICQFPLRLRGRGHTPVSRPH